MPKLKTHKGAAKRFHITGSGKLLRTKGGKSHLRRKKPRRTRGLFDEMVSVSTGDARRIRKCLPYGAKR